MIYPFTVAAPHQDITFRWRYVLTTLPAEAGRNPVLMQSVAGVEGLSPVVTIRDPNGATLISQVFAVEDDDGWYHYTLLKAQVQLEGYYSGTVVVDSNVVDAETLVQYAVVKSS